MEVGSSLKHAGLDAANAAAGAHQSATRNSRREYGGNEELWEERTACLGRNKRHFPPPFTLSFLAASRKTAGTEKQPPCPRRTPSRRGSGRPRRSFSDRQDPNQPWTASADRALQQQQQQQHSWQGEQRAAADNGSGCAAGSSAPPAPPPTAHCRQSAPTGCHCCSSHMRRPPLPVPCRRSAWPC